MPKHLLVMRHAKSSWENQNVTDHDRVLNARGQRDAPRMAQFVALQDWIPEKILCSTASRAAETAQLFLSHSETDSISCEYFRSLYHAAPAAYVRELNRLPDDALETVMVIGHNPGLEELVTRLTQQSVVLPTAAIVLIRLPLHQWNELDLQTSGECLAVWRPKEIV